MQTWMTEAATSLGGIVESRYKSKVTHVVMDCGSDLIARRTPKYCFGVVGGKWVVSLEWVRKSAEANCWLAEDDFEVKGDSVGMGAPEAGRIRIDQGKGALFEGYSCFILGEISKTELRTILKLANARVINRFPKSLEPKKMVILCDADSIVEGTLPQSCQAALEKCKQTKLKFVDYKWILDSISFYKVLPMASYVIDVD